MVSRMHYVEVLLLHLHCNDSGKRLEETAERTNFRRCSSILSRSTDLPHRWQPLLNASSQDIQYRNTLKAANCSSLQCLRSLPEATLRVVNQLTQNISYPDSPGSKFNTATQPVHH